MKIEIVIIDDEINLGENSLMWSLTDKYGEENVQFINEAQLGIDYVKNNLDKNLIIILDYNFRSNEKKGNQVFSEIKEISKLIPVIFFTGNAIESDVYRDLINNHAFGIVNKMTTSEELLILIDSAINFLKNSLDNTIEDWIIEKDEDKDKPVYFTADGKSYSLNQILGEVRKQSDVGKSFSQKLNALTIDLLLRNKEKLNG